MRIDDEFLRLAASGQVPGSSVRKTCVCSPEVKALCPHFQGGVLLMQGLDGSMALEIGPAATLIDGTPLTWPLKPWRGPLPE